MSYAVRLFSLAALGLASSGLLATHARAQDPNGYPVANVNLRAGPGTEYPVILTVPAEAPIAILGCVPDYTWCDSVFEGYRGWMRSIYLAGYYEGSYYPLGDYAPQLGYQTVSFDVGAYWDRYYRDRPFYAERARFAGPREDGWMDDSEFYDRLSPHGQWTWMQGRYVWVPGGVDRGWRPYTRGRWAYTDRGWMWVSNEPFGWATYHYGRWGYSDRVGWFWVPGKRWAPAWVSWRQSDDYLAWAPLPPEPDDGININISIGNVPNYYWQAVRSRDFLDDDLPRRVIYDRDQYGPILERTRPIGHTTIVDNRTIVNNVVNVNYVERTTNKKVVEKKIVRVKEVKEGDRIRDDAIEVYEPEPEAAPKQKAPPEPKKLDEVAAVSETKGQVEGEASTEDQLVPPEVKDAVKKRKGRKGKPQEPGSEEAASVSGEAPLDPSLPKGEEAEGPPPAADAPAAKAPVPAETIATPDLEKDQKGKQDKPERAGKDGPPRTGKDGAPPTAAEPPAAADKAVPPQGAEPDTKEAVTGTGTDEGPGDPDGVRTGKKDAPPSTGDKAMPPPPPPSAESAPPPPDEGSPAAGAPKGKTLKSEQEPETMPLDADRQQGKAPPGADDAKPKARKAGKPKGADEPKAEAPSDTGSQAAPLESGPPPEGEQKSLARPEPDGPPPAQDEPPKKSAKPDQPQGDEGGPPAPQGLKPPGPPKQLSKPGKPEGGNAKKGPVQGLKPPGTQGKGPVQGLKPRGAQGKNAKQLSKPGKPEGGAAKKKDGDQSLKAPGGKKAQKPPKPSAAMQGPKAKQGGPKPPKEAAGGQKPGKQADAQARKGKKGDEKKERN